MWYAHSQSSRFFSASTTPSFVPLISRVAKFVVTIYYLLFLHLGKENGAIISPISYA